MEGKESDLHASNHLIGWVLTEPNRDITWQHATTQTLSYFTAALNVPVEYGEYEDMAEYGQVYYGTMQVRIYFISICFYFIMLYLCLFLFILFVDL